MSGALPDAFNAGEDNNQGCSVRVWEIGGNAVGRCLQRRWDAHKEKGDDYQSCD